MIIELQTLTRQSCFGGLRLLGGVLDMQGRACNYVWCDAYDDPRKILLFSRASEIDLTDRKSMAEANHPASFMYITAGTRLNTLVILSTLTLTQASLE
jgi:hypothetical protein